MLSEVIRKPLFPIVALGLVAVVAFSIIGIQALPHGDDEPEPVTSADFLGDWGAGEQSLAVSDDGSASGNDGCNGIGSTWSFDKESESAVFDGFFGTLMACVDDEGNPVGDGWLRSVGGARFEGPERDRLTFYDALGNRLGVMDRQET